MEAKVTDFLAKYKTYYTESKAETPSELETKKEEADAAEALVTGADVAKLKALVED